MRLARTQFAFEEISVFLQRAGGSSLIESYCVQYLLVSFYAEMEENLAKIMGVRLSAINDRKVAAFIAKTNDKMIRRVKKAEINEMLRAFDCGDGDIIASLSEDNLQPYFDAIANRHLVSHKGGSSMTLDEFGRALPCGEVVLDAVERALAGD